MIERLKSMVRSGDLVASLSVFPEIDEDKIARDLNLDAEGHSRGERDLPASDMKEHDVVEMSAIARIETLRRAGLENYERNRRTYDERLARAGEYRKEVDIVAGTARGDFTAAVRNWKTSMTRSVERLNETFAYREEFRRENNLRRPAKIFSGWVSFISITAILVVLEAGMNAFMFAVGNEQGILGGMITAFIFSMLNVTFCTLAGLYACGLHHRKITFKLLGLICLLAWFSFAIGFNLLIAHFRDLIDAGSQWEAAIQGAVPALTANPFGLSSLDSWILFGIGAVISTLAFLKGWHATDPFPGYARIEQDLALARDAHEESFERAILELTERRDDSIEELRDADKQVREGISEAIDALFGQSALNAHLMAFLDQCDVKVARLLAVYRDANRAARNDPEPASFSQPYKFTRFEPQKVDLSRRQGAEAEADKVSDTVSAAIREIFSSFDDALKEFRLAEEIQRGEHLPQKGE
jgi:hypothetical protein